MTQGQATALLVLLSIPMGFLIIGFTCVVFDDLVLSPIRNWRYRRKRKREEPLEKVQGRCQQLEYDVRYLRQDFNKHVAEGKPPATTTTCKKTAS